MSGAVRGLPAAPGVASAVRFFGYFSAAGAPIVAPMTAAVEMRDLYIAAEVAVLQGRAFAWADGRQFTGESEGVISQAGELRCCAAATVRALERVVQPRLGFELLGVKAVRAFDAVVVIVSLSARQETRASRLVGAYLAEDDPPRGAALAVLNATNRILGNFFATR